MKTENVVLMRKAKESMTGKWDVAIGGFVLFILLYYGFLFVPTFGSFISLIIYPPIHLGFSIFCLSISRNQKANVEQIFEGFNFFVKALTTNILIFLFVFLWSLLLIVPGIIAGLSYSMAFFILSDNPSISAMSAIDLSEKMMEGNKMRLFRLYLRFFGLGLLCVLTLGIGFLWLGPYANVTFAKFYDDVKGDI